MIHLRIINDAIFGTEAPDTIQLHEIFDEMQNHYAALRTAFNMNNAESAHQAPEIFRQQLGMVYAAYEPMTQALTTDDAVAAARPPLKSRTHSVSLTNPCSTALRTTHGIMRWPR